MAQSKLTPQAQQKITEAIELGATYELAANYGGVHYDTFNRWMKAGASAQSGKYYEFYEAVKEAEGRAAVKWLAKIEKAASEGNWQAAAWKLERRYPHEYGRRVTQNEITGAAGGAIRVEIAPLPDDQLDNIFS